MKDLSDTRVLVTGCNGGIGRAICAAFLDSGARVFGVDIQSQSAIEDERLDYRQADLSQIPALEDVLQWVDAGRVNVLVNNAAVFDMGPLVDTDLDSMQRQFDINVRATFRLMQGVASQLIARQEPGRVINFSSQAGRRGEALVAHYCATKAAVISYTQSAALALAPHGINVNAIAPGVVDTPMWDSVDALFAKYEGRPLGEKKRLVGEAVPLGRMGDPDDMVGAVLFFASAASHYITGQTLNVDGGCVLS
ncbi:SDR family oxidoreductase [Litorivicinus lipolyticus]|uniref:SDR family oxidoreductase n=1 Tax=Litorivicinus lipolyticus TaxID=418701 RepID=A0A5Q2QC56_9GAMM|nr:SDR family oxidoreductase [Litorivicinus lipolyticus]QGG79901.1 SDR family oxidoreductase [Litorivicinus lipolyticus]